MSRSCITVAALALTCLAIAACQEQAPARPNKIPLAYNRMYSGAPPTIPHEVASRNREQCLSCHLRGDATGDDGVTVAKATPHPELEHCVSCHVTLGRQRAFRNNEFRGKTYAIGMRATDKAPQLIPHPLTLRENCLGCHDTPRTHPALRVSHPERMRCMQCHLPAYEGAPGPRSNLQAPANRVAEQGPIWSL